MAHYLLSMHSVDGETQPEMSEQQMKETMQKVGELEAEMNSTHTLVASGRLADADTATVVRVQGGDTLTTDGPFAEAKEHLGGFYIIDAADLDEAISWASKTTACIGRPIEVRPFAGFQTPGS